MLFFPALYCALVLEEGELVFADSATTYHEIATFLVLAKHVIWLLVVKREWLCLTNGSGPL